MSVARAPQHCRRESSALAVNTEVARFWYMYGLPPTQQATALHAQALFVQLFRTTGHPSPTTSNYLDSVTRIYLFPKQLRTAKCWTWHARTRYQMTTSHLCPVSSAESNEATSGTAGRCVNLLRATCGGLSFLGVRGSRGSPAAVRLFCALGREESCDRGLGIALALGRCGGLCHAVRDVGEAVGLTRLVTYRVYGAVLCTAQEPRGNQYGIATKQQHRCRAIAGAPSRYYSWSACLPR